MLSIGATSVCALCARLQVPGVPWPCEQPCIYGSAVPLAGFGAEAKGLVGGNCARKDALVKQLRARVKQDAAVKQQRLSIDRQQLHPVMQSFEDARPVGVLAELRLPWVVPDEGGR